MFDYSRKMEWALNKVRLEFLEGIYRGRGLLTWDPEQGFHLEAFLDRQGPPLPGTIHFGKLRVLDGSDVRSVRMTLENGSRAWSNPVPVSEHIELLHSHRLSVDLPHVLFLRRLPGELASERACGSALFGIGRGLAFPDTLEHETRLNGQAVKRAYDAGGIAFAGDGISLRAWLESETHLCAQWELSAVEFRHADAWKWAEAIQWALSFLGGRTIQLLERKTVRGTREFIERRAAREVHDLRLLSMCPRDTRTPHRIDKDTLLRLTRFFLNGGKEADVARHMCAQMTEASRQRSWAGTELLCSTVVEAALRTLRNHPFKEDDRSFNIRVSMDWFRQRYLGAGWENACIEALGSRKRLRHRNAHPDWLTGHGGGMSDAELEQSLDDMIRLAWFYGYMILAMAGFKNLEPRFPAPHKQWGPLITITTPTK